MYTYKAKVVRVIDGDTVDVAIDLGFKVTINARLRLAGIDAPEIRGKEKIEGFKSREWLVDRLPESILVTTGKEKGKYGRWIGTLYRYDVSDDEYVYEDVNGFKLANLNKTMVKVGLAEEVKY